MNKIHITHFSDILCVWAYISQIRIDELEKDFVDNITINYSLFPVFGDIHKKMQRQWHDRGGIEGYSQHVLSVAEQFQHLELNSEVWRTNTPTSSLPAHLFLSAIKKAEQESLLEAGAFTQFKKSIRQAFFTECADVSRHDVLLSLLKGTGLATDTVLYKINNGEAFATLSSDMQAAKDANVTSSPTLIFNEGRQRLEGNVGYKIIEANVRELLDCPNTMQSWCW